MLLSLINDSINIPLSFFSVSWVFASVCELLKFYIGLLSLVLSFAVEHSEHSIKVKEEIVMVVKGLEDLKYVKGRNEILQGPIHAAVGKF